MLNFSTGNMLGGLVFGSIGFVAFVYGKRTESWITMLIGFALMAFPYLVSDTLWMVVVGSVLSLCLYIFRGQ